MIVRSAVSRIDPYLEIGTIGSTSRCMCSFYACSVHALGSFLHGKRGEGSLDADSDGDGVLQDEPGGIDW